jgi:hypothetical protein
MGARRIGILSVRANRGFKESLRGRDFFKLRTLTFETRCFGLGPAAMQAGDILVHLSASELPFVLRPQGSFYQVVGAAFIPQTALDEILKETRRKSVEFEKLEIR